MTRVEVVEDNRSRPPDDAVESELSRRDTWSRAAYVVAAIAATVSILSAALLAVRHGWVPVGDYGVFAIRARDVFSRHPPLLGTWTSASLATGVNVNNPGPLYYDAIAIPTVLVGSAGAGVAVGVALVHALCGLGAGWVARRQGGWLVGSIAFAAVTLLAWALGSEALVEPTQPSAMLFPALLLFMVAWGVARGDVVLLPLLALVASLVLQTYVTYVYIVGALVLWAVAAMLLGRRAARAALDDSRRLRTSAIATLIVVALCWAQPVWQQLFGPGPGNIASLVRAARRPQHAVGFDTGTRLVADVLARPPFWFRPSYRDFLATTRAPSSSLPFALLSIAAVVAALVGIVVVAWRRADRVLATAAATAVVLIGAGLFTGARTLLTPLLGIDAHVYRWLWAVGAFVTFVFVVSIVLLFVPVRRAHVVAGVAATVAVAFALLNLATYKTDTPILEPATPAVRDLGHQLAALHVRGPVVVVAGSSSGFGDPYGASVLALLQGRGIPFLTTDETFVHQLGTFRRFNGHNARLKMTIVEGDGYANAPPGAERVALHYGLSSRERAERARLEDALASAISSGRITLDAHGARDVRAGAASPLPVGAARDVAVRFVRSFAFATLVARDDLALDRAQTQAVDRYRELSTRWANNTVALYLAPLSARS